jgi:hypothetical protein
MATYKWTSTGSGDWTTGTNWSGGAYPNATTAVVVLKADGQTATIAETDPAITVQSLILNNQTVVDDGQLTIVNVGQAGFGGPANTGAIVVDVGGTLVLGGTVTLAELGQINATDFGEVVIAGTLDLGGGQLTVAPYTDGALSNVVIDGTVRDGTFFEQSSRGFYGALSPILTFGASARLIDVNTNLIDVTLAQLQTLEAGNTGRVDIFGVLDLQGGTLDIIATGSLSNIALFGPVKNGTIIEQGGMLALGGGATTLDGVTLDGPLALTAPGGVAIEDGFTPLGLNGGQPGSIDLTSPGAGLFVIDYESLDHLAISFGSNGDGSFLNAQAGQLALGPSTTLTEASGADTFLGNIVNYGTITVTNSQLETDGGFTNEGYMLIGQGGALLSAYSSFIYNGTLEIGRGGTFEDGTYFSTVNTGSLIVDGGGTLRIDGALSLAQLGNLAVRPYGEVLVTGTLDLDGDTLHLNGATIVVQGMVENGTIDSGVVQVDGGALAGVTTNDTIGSVTLAQLEAIAAGHTGPVVVSGTLDLQGGTLDIAATGSLSNVTITGKVMNGAIVDAGGTLGIGGPLSGVGLIDLAGAARLDILTDETLAGVRVVMEPASTPVIDIAQGATLTLGSDASLTAESQAGGTIEGGAAFINNGLMTIDDSFLVIANTASFDNTGTILDDSYSDFRIGVDISLLQLGSIAVAQGQAVLEFTTAFATFLHDGTFYRPVYTLDLGGGTLDVGSGPFASDLQVGDDVHDGTIVVTGDSYWAGLESGATLDGITVVGAIFTYGTIAIQNGATFEGANLAPGTIDFGGGELFYLDSETLDNVTLGVGHQILPSWTLSAAAGATLTLGSGAVVTASALNDYSQPNDVELSGGASLVNNGTIQLSTYSHDTYAHESFASFTNNGTFAGDTLDVSGNLVNTGTIDVFDLILSGSVDLATLVGKGLTAQVLSVDGTLDLGGGTIEIGMADAIQELQIGQSGTIANGRIVATDGTIVLQGGAGLPGNGATLDSASTLELAPSLGGTTDLSALSHVSGQGTLVIDAGETLDLGGGVLDIGAGGAFSAIVLQGSIDNYSYINGALQDIVTPGGAIIDGTIVNDGGTVTTNAGGTVSGITFVTPVAGTISLSDLQTLEAGNTGPITITGTLDLQGGTLDITATGSLSSIEIAGTVRDGTIIEDGGTLVIAPDPTLDHVTLLGSLDLSAANTTLDIVNGLTVQTASGGLPGTIELTGANSILQLLDSETLDNVVINLGTSTLGLSQRSSIAATYPGTLTLGGNALLIAAPGANYNGEGTAAISTYGLINDGTIEATGGWFYTFSNLFTNDGTIATDGSTAIIIADNVFTNAGTIAVGAGGEVAIDDYTTFDNTGGVTVATGGLLEFVGTANIARFGTVTLAGGVLDVPTGTTLALGGPDRIAGFGTIDAALTVAGTIAASGGLLDIAQAPGYPSGITHGTLQIDPGATLELADGSAIGIAFNGPATLQLDTPGANTGTLTNIAAGDTIVLAGETITGATSTGNTLTIDTTGGAFTYALAAPLGGLAVHHAGDAVTFATAACYLHGTAIATPTGERPIEELAIGDLVTTASGQARPIRWIGRRAYPRRFVSGKRDILPILIRANALGENGPHRDLYVSPHHAMFIDGLLVPAISLRNGRSIVQIEAAGPIEYLHIELDSHDIVLAEGAPSESFEDDDSRMIFHNAADYFARYPDAPPRPARFCAPRVSEGPRLAAIRARLDPHSRRAPALLGAVWIVAPRQIAGWAEHPEHPGAPVCLDILVGDELIAQTLARPGEGFSVRPAVPLTAADLALVQVRRSMDQTPLARAA